MAAAYAAHSMCGGLCRGWGCCEARGVAQPQDGSGEARGEGEGEGELSSDGDSDGGEEGVDWFAGDPAWGSAALEDEWRAASLARQAVGDAAYAAAHAAGASRAEACDAAVRAVRADRVEARSSFLVRAGWPAPDDDPDEEEDKKEIKALDEGDIALLKTYVSRRRRARSLAAA
ncbi:hypothetical protein EMIHUDRAFT_220590 [Emiliania huxleyi CCMP1516]|uniref:Uncharacterized protein n=2 Tax=Emiliania huxleyi TaxID=2903 RepID=A0A0D3I0P1_EMIH1|nr:hypothetical protein EMIHUDRAFT_220590 [Emiliania huxleyi CCMP1516]EOD04826.1 hypothetical protein EMIHUDRAFT_220590 [Emiliania huxleyi CCMP1516]|eukprot:XP_005757255.1 hypothetical protein EMIHUDRAFT_220590 [Emiliania huxleyi CCMP1516]